MADHFTHFTCLLDVGTSENAARALDLYNRLSEDSASKEPPSEGFLLSIHTDGWLAQTISGEGGPL